MNKDEFEEFKKYCKRQDIIRLAVMCLICAIMCLEAGMIVYVTLTTSN